MKKGKDISVLFLGKKDDFFCDQAEHFVALNFSKAEIVRGGRGDPFPEAARKWKGDYIFSYLSPWIVPRFLLERASAAAVNFHPGPPEYPGIGCTNFAIYHREIRFGVTCHHMLSRVDTGRIIRVHRFPLFSTDSVHSLTLRCYGHILSLFYDIVSDILAGEPLPESSERWQRAPYKRSELNDLCKITEDMPAAEIERRIQATRFPGMPGAYVEIRGFRFDYREGKQ